MSTCRIMKIDLYLSPCTKVKAKQMKDLGINLATLNLIEEKVGSSLQCTKYKPSSTDTERDNKYTNLQKLRSFCKAKDTLNKTKKQPIECSNTGQ